MARDILGQLITVRTFLKVEVSNASLTSMAVRESSEGFFVNQPLGLLSSQVQQIFLNTLVLGLAPRRWHWPFQLLIDAIFPLLPRDMMMFRSIDVLGVGRDIRLISRPC